jgi:thiol:disulfide interchange protein DsbC
MKLPPIISCCLLLAFIPSALALTPDEVRQLLIQRKLEVESVDTSAIKGMYAVTLASHQMLYISEDGQHFVNGDLFQLTSEGFENVSKTARNGWRKHLIDQIDSSELVVFSPPADKVKATVNVFTDIDCGFCRKLHTEVPELNRMGIAVRYLAFPRAGIESHSYVKYVSSWCAADRQKAFTLAKLGDEPKLMTCKNPVAEQYQLGSEIGVTGTPALVFEDGTLSMGYRSAEQLARTLGVVN